MVLEISVDNVCHSILKYRPDIVCIHDCGEI